MCLALPWQAGSGRLSVLRGSGESEPGPAAMGG
jgi:hypothetical protein